MLLSTPWRLLLSTMLLLGIITSRSKAQDVQVEDMSFVDDEHGWVSMTGPNPTIFRTSDGGKTWARLSVPSKRGYYNVQFLDRHVGIAIQFYLSHATTIYRTIDGGQTWEKVNEIRAPNGETVLRPNLNSRAEGFLVGNGAPTGPYVLQLLNGGRTVKVRTDVAHLSDGNAYCVFGDGTGHIWIAGDGFILHSADGGKTWEKQSPTPDPDLYAAGSGIALPGGHAWVTIEAEIYRTDDYGKNWTRALATTGASFTDFDSISFRNLREGCAVGNSSFIYCTADGGITWSRSKVFHTVPNGSTSPFPKLQLFGSSHGWATIDGALYKTEDGGRSFTEVLTKSAPVESGVPGEFQARKTWINGPADLAYEKRCRGKSPASCRRRRAPSGRSSRCACAR